MNNCPVCQKKLTLDSNTNKKRCKACGYEKKETEIQTEFDQKQGRQKIGKHNIREKKQKKERVYQKAKTENWIKFIEAFQLYLQSLINQISIDLKLDNNLLKKSRELWFKFLSKFEDQEIKISFLSQQEYFKKKRELKSQDLKYKYKNQYDYLYTDNYVKLDEDPFNFLANLHFQEINKKNIQIYFLMVQNQKSKQISYNKKIKALNSRVYSQNSDFVQKYFGIQQEKISKDSALILFATDYLKVLDKSLERVNIQNLIEIYEQLRHDQVAEQILFKLKLSALKKNENSFTIDYNLIINIIYISLREVKQPIFPKDLINYLKKCPLFYKGIFPDQDQFQYQPITLPDPDYLRKYSNKLQKFIGIKGSNIFLKYLEKFQLQCEIPFQIIKMVENMKQSFKECQFRKEIDQDIFVVGLLILTLKFIYGLDDKFHGIQMPTNLSKFRQDQKNRIKSIKENMQKNQDFYFQFYEQIPNLQMIIKNWKQKILDTKREQLHLLKYQDLKYSNFNNILKISEQNDQFEHNDQFKDILYTLNGIELKQEQQQVIKIDINEIKEPQQDLQFSEYFDQELQFYEIGFQIKRKIQYPLPCDNYIMFTKFEDLSDQMKFILNFFCNYIDENPNFIFKIIKKMENFLVK